MSIADKITSIETHLENDYEGLENLGVTAEDRNIENIRTCLDELYNNIPKTTDTGTNLSLNTIKGKMNIIPKGDTSQNGTPTPSTPIDIEVVTGTQEVKVENKNLYDNSKTNGKWINMSGTIVDNVFSNIQKINCKPSDTFTLSFTFDTADVNSIVLMAFYDINNTLLNRSVTANVLSGTLTRTAPANTSYMYVGHYQRKPLTMQVEYGSTATDFVEHQEQTQTISLGDIELCKIGNYQDYLYKSGDKWYKKEYIGNKKASDITTSNLGLADQGIYFNPSFTGVKADRTLQVYSNTQTWKNSVDTNWNTLNGNYIGVLYNVQQIYINKSGTKEDILTWLNSIGFEMRYVLATPQDIEITNTTLIEQLNNLEKMYSYNGITNISSSGNLPIVLGVSALKGE